MAAHSVLVAGHLCIDITPELSHVPQLAPGQLYEVGPAQLTLGGCVANTGLALAVAGVPTRVCATVGDDPLGEIIRRLLAEHGVDMQGVTTTAGAATSYTIVLQVSGHDRTFWHHPGANAAFTGREVNLDGTDILHLGYPPLLPALLEDDAAPLLDLLKEARSKQITTSLDLVVVDPRSPVAELNWRRIFTRIMPYVDIATPSIDDLTSALGITRTPDDELVAEVPSVCWRTDAPSPSCRRAREGRTRPALARIAWRRPELLFRPSDRRGVRQRNGYRRLRRGSSSVRREPGMPPPPDSCTALLTGPAFRARHGSVPGSPPPASKESDRRLRMPAAGPPSWPQQAGTDSVDATCRAATRTFSTKRAQRSLATGLGRAFSTKPAEKITGLS